MPDSLKARQYFTFSVTWVSYALTYFLRKPLGVIKPDLEMKLQMNKSLIGWFDTALLLPYAVMQMLLGGIADKVGAGLALSICLIGSALSMVSFGYWNHTFILALLLFLNGTFQATAWPNCVKILSSWYSNEQRASIFGLWGTCVFVGGIFGTSLAVYIQAIYSPDLKMVFIVPSLLMLGFGIFVYFTLKMPADLNIVIPGKNVTPITSDSVEENKVLSFYEIFSLKLVPELVLTVVCMKLVRYCFYMWLPMYLHEGLDYTKAHAGILSTIFEIGGVFGSASIGFIINRVFQGRILFGCFVVVLLSAFTLILFEITSSGGFYFHVVLLFIAGICNCGPDPHLSGTVPAKIGEKVNAQAAVSGFINGFGGTGAIIEGPIIGLIVDAYGWSGAFYFMVILSFIAALSLFRASKLVANTDTVL